MGSRSKSSNSTTSNFYDNRQVNDAGGGVVATGGATVFNTTTDSGSVSAAFNFAKEAQEDAAGFNALAVTKVFDLMKSSQAQAAESSTAAIGAAMQATGAIKDAYQKSQDAQTGTRPLMYVALAAAGVLGAVLIFGKR